MFSLSNNAGLARSVEKKGRVENRLSPALPHQTVHGFFSTWLSDVLHAEACAVVQLRLWEPCRTRARIEVKTRKTVDGRSSVLHFMMLHQARSQPVFHMVPDFAHCKA
jgi:hypothetical protein